MYLNIDDVCLSKKEGRRRGGVRLIICKRSGSDGINVNVYLGFIPRLNKSQNRVDDLLPEELISRVQTKLGNRR